jgi:hypothetical protein
LTKSAAAALGASPVLTKPTLAIAVEYEDPTAYYALTRAEHREIERSLVGTIKTFVTQPLLDAWAVLDPAQVKVGNTVLDVGDESMSIANVRAFVDAQLAKAGDGANTFRTLSSVQFAPSRACHWIDLLHKDGFTFCIERNKNGQPYKLTATASTGKSATAFIKIKF